MLIFSSFLSNFSILFTIFRNTMWLWFTFRTHLISQTRLFQRVFRLLITTTPMTTRTTHSAGSPAGEHFLEGGSCTLILRFSLCLQVLHRQMVSTGTLANSRSSHARTTPDAGGVCSVQFVVFAVLQNKKLAQMKRTWNFAEDQTFRGSNIELSQMKLHFILLPFFCSGSSPDILQEVRVDVMGTPATTECGYDSVQCVQGYDNPGSVGGCFVCFHSVFSLRPTQHKSLLFRTLRVPPNSSTWIEFCEQE